MKKTIFFGGSFDPIHEGHLAIAYAALNELQAYQVLFVLAPLARWKDPESSVFHRLEMMKIALKDEPRFKISTIELAQEGELHTIDTVKKYLKTAKDEELYLLIGADQVAKFPSWHQSEELASLVHVIYSSRKGYEIDENIVNKYQMQKISSPLVDVSSSDIRKLEITHIQKEILDYIGVHRLYYVEDLLNLIGEKRLNHSLSVASLAFDLAKANDMDLYKAYIAGLLHDCAKRLPLDEHLYLIEKMFSKEILKNVEAPLYHQFSGATLAKEYFKIEDPEILDAIAYHATGKANMSRLGRLLYAADKIEPTRDFDSSELIMACMRDLETGFIEVLKDNIKYFRTKGIKYQNYLTLECIDYYLKENKGNGRN